MKKSLFILALCLTIGTAASACDIVSVCPTGQILGYNILSENPPEVSLDSCDIYSYWGGVTIPDSVEFNFKRYAVVAIGPEAFYNGCLGSYFSGPLVIPNTVRTIGTQAFFDCWFTGPLIIPNSVTEIGEWAFYGCRKFSSLTLSESLTYIANNTFDECDNMRGDLIIPQSVVDIGSESFSKCAFDGTLSLSPKMTYIFAGGIIECYNFTSVVIPEGIEYIDFMAFDFLHKPTELELPSTLSYIEDLAFCNMVKLQQMTVNATIPPIIGDETFQRVNHGIPVYIPVGTKEDYQNASGWSEFTNLIELEGVGLSEKEGVAMAAAYPNPGFSTLNIQTDSPNAEMEVYDMTGRLIHRQTIAESTATIDATLWPSGLYVWRVVSEKKEETTGKWIKK